MTLIELMREAGQAGVVLFLRGDQVRVDAPVHVLERLRPALRAHRDAIRVVIPRAEAMRRHAADTPLAWPFLIARPCFTAGVGECLSCGEPVVEAARCAPCVAAAWLVTSERKYHAGLLPGSTWASH